MFKASNFGWYTEKKKYTIIGGHLLYKDGLVIPYLSVHIPLILFEFHNGLARGYSDIFLL